MIGVGFCAWAVNRIVASMGLLKRRCNRSFAKAMIPVLVQTNPIRAKGHLDLFLFLRFKQSSERVISRELALVWSIPWASVRAGIGQAAFPRWQALSRGLGTIGVVASMGVAFCASPLDAQTRHSVRANP